MDTATNLDNVHPRPGRAAIESATSEKTAAYDRNLAVLAVIADLRALKPGGVDRVSNITPETFLSRYYAANEPLLWQGLLRNWPAFRKWSPQYFTEHYGKVQVEVMTGLRQHPNYEVKPEQQCQAMCLQDFVETVQLSPDSGDLYLVAQNHALQNPALAPLLADIEFDINFFDPGADTNEFSLWFGPGNTVTPLHYDLKNVMLAQVFGRKQVKLISPLHTSRVYNHRGGYSQVNPEQPDLQKFPLFEGVPVYTVMLEPGDALFLPYGWWHQVRSLCMSLSLSLSNFVWPNSFPSPK